MDEPFIILLMTKRGLRTAQDDDGYTMSFKTEDEARLWGAVHLIGYRLWLVSMEMVDET